MTISFKFSVFNLEIEHKILKELGEFTIFCMKTINNKMTIEDISNIIQIKKKIIKKQLTFAISRKYLNDDFTLTEKGIDTIALFEFINVVNQQKVEIALEHYIESNSKCFYLATNPNFEDTFTGSLVKDNLFDYKIQNSFDKTIEEDRSKIQNILVTNFENYKELIDKHLEDFIFKIEKLEKQKFYNYKISRKEFIDELYNKNNKILNFISINIPILEIKKIVTSKILIKTDLDKIESKFDKYRYFNLIDGQNIKINSKVENKNSNLKLEPLLNKMDIMNMNYNSENFNINDFLFIDIKTNISNFYENKFFDITKIMEEICEV